MIFIKIGELKKIIHLLPDDLELYFEDNQITQNTFRNTLFDQRFGNHDGSYIRTCEKCGWSSDYIKHNETIDFCPKGCIK